MGNNTVAVLYNDMHRELAEAMPRLGWAMRHFGFGGRSRAKEEAHFGCGQIISCDHASGYQVVVVHGNTGWRVGADEEIRPDVIFHLAAAVGVKLIVESPVRTIETNVRGIYVAGHFTHARHIKAAIDVPRRIVPLIAQELSQPQKGTKSTKN